MRDIIRSKSCTEAWLQAVDHLRKQDGCRDYNLILEISHPLSLSPSEKDVCAELNNFLISNNKHSVSTVINTIFPASLAVKHTADEVFKRYREEIAPRLCKHHDTRWGTYFMRMTNKTDANGKTINPLEYLIAKLKREGKVSGSKRAVYELNLVEPFLDVPIYDANADRHYHMGGPCLSHVSFKLKSDHSLILTALYRSHYYIERALGNLYGLAMLQDFVVREAGIKAAELVCHSTMAILDTDGITKSSVTKMIDVCARLRDAPKVG